MRTRLMEVAADQPSVRERVPLFYLKLLDVVRIQRRLENVPITSWSRLREWAGFEDEKQLERAVQLLHDWGELLWFSEVAALRDMVVLSPQWLTSMFATIISSKDNDDVPGPVPAAGVTADSPAPMDPRSSASEAETPGTQHSHHRRQLSVGASSTAEETDDTELGLMPVKVGVR